MPSATMSLSARSLLQEACASNSLSHSTSLSSDGQTLTILGSPIDARSAISVPLGTDDAVASYSIASVYLMLLTPSVLQYRKACESFNVEDPVKVLDRVAISSFFLGPTDKSEDMEMSDDDDNDNDGEQPDDVKEKQPSHSQQEQQHPVSNRDHSKNQQERKYQRHVREKASQQDRTTKSNKVKHDDWDATTKKRLDKPVAITNEQLVANLSTIVDKRDKNQTKERKRDDTQTSAAQNDMPDGQLGNVPILPSVTPLPSELERGASSDNERELILSCLSSTGFEVNSPQILAAIEADREATRRIMALEIPVGDSASILRAGAGGEIVEGMGSSIGGVKKRDFSRVLEIYQEVMQAEEKAKRANVAVESANKRPGPPSSSTFSKNIRVAGTSSSSTLLLSGVKKIEGNPVIVVPNAMTSLITMINAGFFLGKESTYVPRELAMKRSDAGKRGGTITITHKLASRLGGGEVQYDIIDNPTTRFKKDEWDRVVAVIAQGASWQFKGWRYSDPVDLFSRVFGFYVGFEGAVVPSELQGWNVKVGKISRDRRGLDNVCLASFWNGLEEFMAVHKQECLKIC